MRILFASTRGAGHIGPIAPFARAHGDAGDDVLLAAPASAERAVARAGVRHWRCADPPEQQLADVLGSAAEAGPGEASTRTVVDVFGRSFARLALPGLLAAIESFRPDVVVRETHELAASVAAELHGLPHARIGVMRAAGEAWAVAAVAPVLDELRAEFGLRPDPRGERLLRGPYLTLAPRALEDPAHAEPAALRFRDAGSVPRPLPDWWPGDRRPLVYLSFGSEVPRLGLFPRLYREALAALAALPVRVLVTVGDARDPGELGALPASVHVERWVEQERVMPQAALIVCHGGFGSTRAALAAGVPLVVLPFFADQPHNAQRVAAAGAGLALEGGADAVPQLAAAVARVLHEPGFRAAAQAIADETRALPSVSEAPRLLAGLLRTG